MASSLCCTLLAALPTAASDVLFMCMSLGAIMTNHAFVPHSTRGRAAYASFLLGKNQNHACTARLMAPLKSHFTFNVLRVVHRSQHDHPARGISGRLFGMPASVSCTRPGAASLLTGHRPPPDVPPAETLGPVHRVHSLRPSTASSRWFGGVTVALAQQGRKSSSTGATYGIAAQLCQCRCQP